VKKSPKKQILLLTRYGNLSATSRLRFLQFVPALNDFAEVHVSPLFSDSYLADLYKSHKRQWWKTFLAYWVRGIQLFTIWKYDLIWIEKELFPFVPAIAERILRMLNIPYIVDYDDAVFHTYDLHPHALVRKLYANKISNVMRYATIVTVGNCYIEQYARNAQAQHIEIIPTVVDMKRYLGNGKEDNRHLLIVGWIGSPSTVKYVQALLPVLEQIAESQPFVLRLVGGSLTSERIKIENVVWSEACEANLISEMDVGIMPLFDTPWEQGKCGYKLIQYMASGIPVIASPIGVNASIVQSDAGYLATTPEEWKQALIRLLSEPLLRTQMGAVGKKRVEAFYSLSSTEGVLKKIVSDALAIAT